MVVNGKHFFTQAEDGSPIDSIRKIAHRHDGSDISDTKREVSVSHIGGNSQSSW